GYPFSVTFPAPATSHVIDGIPDGALCRFVLTAIDSGGRESGYSNEVAKFFPAVEVADPVVGPTITWEEATVTVAFDAFSSNNQNETWPASYTHTPSGTPRAVIVRVLADEET